MEIGERWNGSCSLAKSSSFELRLLAISSTVLTTARKAASFKQETTAAQSQLFRSRSVTQSQIFRMTGRKMHTTNEHGLLFSSEKSISQKDKG